MENNIEEMRSSTGLLPCPFCGSVDLSRLKFPAKGDKPEFNFLQCNSCLATGPHGHSEDAVRALWDFRAEKA